MPRSARPRHGRCCRPGRACSSAAVSPARDSSSSVRGRVPAIAAPGCTQAPRNALLLLMLLLELQLLELLWLLMAATGCSAPAPAGWPPPYPRAHSPACGWVDLPGVIYSQSAITSTSRPPTPTRTASRATRWAHCSGSSSPASSGAGPHNVDCPPKT